MAPCAQVWGTDRTRRRPARANVLHWRLRCWRASHAHTLVKLGNVVLALERIPALHRQIAHVTGDRCVALTDVEATLVLAALTEGGLDAERFVEIARARQVAMAEGRVRALRWLDVCELAGVDPWGVPRPSTMSLGVALAKLGLEAVRIETLGGVG